MPISFVERVKLGQGNDLIMTYRGQILGSDFFAYIKCTAQGTKLMHADYETSTARALEEYGEVFYRGDGKDPDDTAKEFLKDYLSEHGGEPI